jgi:glycerate kinase
VPVILAAPDKFRGTATAHQASEAIARAASSRGRRARQMPLSDGGEGFIEVLAALGGGRERVGVTGPLGSPVEASYLRLGNLAVLEMARASGLALAGGSAGNDALAATTRGTGQLMVAAARALARPAVATAGPGAARSVTRPIGSHGQARTIVVGLGGSATTDGGLGALRWIEGQGGLGDTEVVGACDVTVGFVDAAEGFSRQKGADESQVVELEGRLRRLAERYEAEYGVDVRTVSGSGAAGGLGGALVVLGGRLRSGFEVVAELVGFHDAVARSSLVVTGEGALDATSLSGKVVGSVVREASASGAASLVIAGRASLEASEAVEALGARVVSLSGRFGEERALSDVCGCIETAVAEHLDATGGG